MELTVNGKTLTVDAPEDMPVLWVLRDVIGMTGTKFGCGIAACGACTVHLDGQPIQSPRALAVLDLAAKQAGWDSPLPAGHGRGVSFMYSRWDTYLAQVAEVEVAGGELKVRRVVCAVDCGTVVNPDTVAAQIESGVIFGIGGALWGEITVKNGRVEQSNFTDYRVLRMNELPPIEVHLVRNFEAPGGIGEPGTAGLAPALANAVFAATGKRIRQLPLQKALTA